MSKKSWIIDGVDRMYRVTSVEEIDELIAEMMAVPEAERGERFEDEIDCLLDGRNKVARELS